VRIHRLIVVCISCVSLMVALAIYAGMNRFVLISGADGKSVTYFDRWTAEVCKETYKEVVCKQVAR
jgi:hypothetical protein